MPEGAEQAHEAVNVGIGRLAIVGVGQSGEMFGPFRGLGQTGLGLGVMSRLAFVVVGKILAQAVVDLGSVQGRQHVLKVQEQPEFKQGTEAMAAKLARRLASLRNLPSRDSAFFRAL